MVASHSYQEQASKVRALMAHECGFLAHGQRELKLQPSIMLYSGQQEKGKEEEGYVSSFLRVLAGYFCIQYFCLYLISQSLVMRLCPALREARK